MLACGKISCCGDALAPSLIGWPPLLGMPTDGGSTPPEEALLAALPHGPPSRLLALALTSSSPTASGEGSVATRSSAVLGSGAMGSVVLAATCELDRDVESRRSVIRAHSDERSRILVTVSRNGPGPLAGCVTVPLVALRRRRRQRGWAVLWSSSTLHQGRNLKGILKNVGRCTPEREGFSHFVRQVGAALEAVAHREGIIHRDSQARGCWWVQDGVIRLADLHRRRACQLPRSREQRTVPRDPDATGIPRDLEGG